MALTYATSLIQTYTETLQTNLRNRTGLREVLITDGPPPISVLDATNAWLMLGDVSGLQDFATISTRRPRDEEFSIDCLISVMTPVGGDLDSQTPISRRAMAIMAEVEDELRGNPTQNVGPATGSDPAGYVVSSQISGPIDLTKRANDQNREAALRFTVIVKARL
jgi:hypothetical protein